MPLQFGSILLGAVLGLLGGGATVAVLLIVGPTARVIAGLLPGTLAGACVAWMVWGRALDRAADGLACLTDDETTGQQGRAICPCSVMVFWMPSWPAFMSISTGRGGFSTISARPNAPPGCSVPR